MFSRLGAWCILCLVTEVVAQTISVESIKAMKPLHTCAPALTDGEDALEIKGSLNYGPKGNKQMTWIKGSLSLIAELSVEEWQSQLDDAFVADTKFHELAVIWCSSPSAVTVSQEQGKCTQTSPNAGKFIFIVTTRARYSGAKLEILWENTEGEVIEHEIKVALPKIEYGTVESSLHLTANGEFIDPMDCHIIVEPNAGITKVVLCTKDARPMSLVNVSLGNVDVETGKGPCHGVSIQPVQAEKAGKLVFLYQRRHCKREHTKLVCSVSKRPGVAASSSGGVTEESSNQTVGIVLAVCCVLTLVVAVALAVIVVKQQKKIQALANEGNRKS